MTNADWLDRLFDSMFAAGVVKIDTRPDGGFKMKKHETQPDARLSPIYLNIRTQDNPKPGPVTEEMAYEIGKAMWLHIWDEVRKEGIRMDAVAGLPHAGTPLARGFAQAAKETGPIVPIIVLRKDVQDGSRRITGIVDNGGVGPFVDNEQELRQAVVLVLDDLLTEGHSKMEGVRALEQEGYLVQDIIVFLDREQGGAEQIRRENLRLHSVTTLSRMLNRLAATGKISTNDRDIIIQYLAEERRVPA